ncbi:TD and POZ domain-containing protein 4 [Eumeta japonica]|uniref:TD and POZ domain-containing protein 4 n=1 Tax=Eumeta variegata TaxID=151549 RepID=A0A4C1T496_EUMVA|nr:TD and POZ domain-containing protein 4 [Eumeta japonica]
MLSVIVLNTDRILPAPNLVLRPAVANRGCGIPIYRHTLRRYPRHQPRDELRLKIVRYRRSASCKGRNALTHVHRRPHKAVWNHCGRGCHRRPHQGYYIENDAVTTLNKCETENARKLYIFDIATKLRSPGTYDIGGTYAEHPEFWFLFKTSFCPGKNYLLSLFVCHRVPGSFHIGVSSTNSLTFRKATGVLEKSRLTSNLAWYMFKNEQKDTNFYVKTFCFSEGDVKSLEQRILCIALRIKDKMPLKLLPDIIKKIKLQHDFGELLTKPDKTDFVLISSSGSKFPTHKIILVAHSPVLRESIKSTTSSSLELDITDEDMKVLLQFMYTGTIKDLASHDGTKLLNLAEKYGLKTMFALMQHTIMETVSLRTCQLSIACEPFEMSSAKSIPIWAYTFART